MEFGKAISNHENRANNSYHRCTYKLWNWISFTSSEFFGKRKAKKAENCCTSSAKCFHESLVVSLVCFVSL